MVYSLPSGAGRTAGASQGGPSDNHGTSFTLSGKPVPLGEVFRRWRFTSGFLPRNFVFLPYKLRLAMIGSYIPGRLFLGLGWGDKERQEGLSLVSRQLLCRIVRNGH